MGHVQRVFTVLIKVDDGVESHYNVALRVGGLKNVWQFGVEDVVVKGSYYLLLAVGNGGMAACGDLEAEVARADAEIVDSRPLFFAFLWLLWLLNLLRSLVYLSYVGHLLQQI